MCLHRFEHALIRFRARNLERISSEREGDSGMREVGLRIVVASLKATYRSATHVGTAEQQGLIEIIQQVNAFIESLTRQIPIAGLAFRGAELVQNSGPEKWIGLRR